MTDAPESATHRDQLEDARDLIVDAQNKIDDWRADPWDIDELESWLDSQQ